MQPTHKHRYAIWPNVGVVQPGANVFVSIVLLERARSELEQTFGKVDPSSTDKIVVEWCRAPEAVFRRLGLTGDSDQDYEILSSFWNTKGYEFSTPVLSARQPLGVRYSMGRSPDSSIDYSISNPNSDSVILPTVSLDTSTTQADPSFLCDDSLMLSVSTAEEDWREFSAAQGRGGDVRMTRPNSNQTTSRTKPIPKSTIHKFQLQQTLRCNGCYQVFSRDPDSFTIPVMSQACGHTICRGCVVRKADEDFAFAQSYQSTIWCPLCQAPDAFSQELHINQSLCAVIALLDP